MEILVPCWICHVLLAVLFDHILEATCYYGVFQLARNHIQLYHFADYVFWFWNLRIQRTDAAERLDRSFEKMGTRGFGK